MQVKHPPHKADRTDADETPRLDSRELFGTANRVEIAYGDRVYLLQITRQGKLILTK